MEDFKDKQIVQRVIDNSLSGIQDDPWMAQRVLNMAHETQGTGGIVVKKKLSIGFVLMMAVMLLGVTALAATLLWQDAGEKVAPMESENGYYDTWNTEAKIELIKALYDLGELKDNPDAERVLNSTDMPDAEKNALCDKIMCAYVNGSPDTTRNDRFCVIYPYGEKNSQQDTNKIHDRLHLSIFYFHVQLWKFDF